MSFNRAAASSIFVVKSIISFVSHFLSLKSLIQTACLLIGVFSGKQLFAKLISLTLVIAIMVSTTPAAPQVIISTSIGIGQNLRYAYLTSPTLAYLSEINLLDNPVISFFFKPAKRKQTISRIEVSPNRATIREGEEINFAAVGIDSRGNPVQGLEIRWTAKSTRQKAASVPIINGSFKPQFSDRFEITAESNGFKGTAVIQVLKDPYLLALQEMDKKTLGKDSSQARRQVRGDVQKLVDSSKATAFKVSTRMSPEEAREISRQEKEFRNANPRINLTDPKEKFRPIRKAQPVQQTQTGMTQVSNEENTPEKVGGPNSSEKVSESSPLLPGVSGYLNGINGATLTGCATNQNYGVMVDFYIDGDVYSGVYAGNAFAGMSCDFSFQIPANYQDGQPHTISAFAWDSDYGYWVELSNSPQSFQLGGSGSGTNSNWNNGNYVSADDPGLQPGDQPNTGTDGAGSGNFGFSAPVLSLGGRGMSVNLSLNYNSLLWHKSGSEISYDIDKGNPAPGWNIGFGKMMDMGSTGGSMIEETDGSRHSYQGTAANFWSGGYSHYYGQTTDGSFIDYSSYKGPAGIISGAAYFPNGTIIYYGAAANGVAYPTKILDRHGNYILIAYQNNQGPNITTVTDNLGRVVTFNYDAANRLVSITGPGFNGSTQTLVRLHYTQQTLSLNYSGLTTQVRDSNPYQIDAIYYPATNTGYWFADSDSYSGYGMIKKVKEVRNMTCNCPSNTDQGTMTQGIMTRQQVYDYQTTGALTEAPKYTKMTEDWFGREPSTPVAETLYGISTNPASPNPRTTTITLPNGNKITQFSNNSPGVWYDGLLDKVETRAPNNDLLSKTAMNYEQGDYGSVRVIDVSITDEKTQTTKQVFTYNSNGYNQVSTISEYGYSNNLLRKKVNTYENGANYTGGYNTVNGFAIWSWGRHIFSLLKTEEIRDSTDVRLSRTEYNYDQTPLVNPLAGFSNPAPVLMYEQSYNPYTTEMTTGPNCVQWDTYWVEDNDPPWYGGYWETVCVEYEQIPNFNQSTIARGNMTETISYSDAVNLQGAIPHNSTYDIVGNVRTATTDCCQQMSFVYSDATQYSQPVSHTKGGGSATTQNTETAMYDFNTGLMISSTDFNGLTTTAEYDAALRPIQTNLPTGAKSQTAYDDVGLKVTQTSRLADNTIVSQGESYANGRGQVVLSKSLAGSSWNAAVVKYDTMGRKNQSSLPFDANASPTQWTTYQYDLLSRVTQVTAPDGSVSTTIYNDANQPSSAASNVGNTVRSVDAWGRERWARTDDFGRLVEVVEPDPNGNGSVLASGNMVTSYQYDPLDQLTLVTQGAQQRAFKYDSLGRLTRQKLAEQANSIEGLWSDAFEYDTRSNLVQRTDARGVKTNFVYNNDPLNRLQSINYDKTQAANPTLIADAGAVTIGYETGGDKSRVSNVTTAATSITPAVTEVNTYDAYSRISEYGMTIGTKPVMQMNYLYDSANRLTKVIYPQQYGTSNPSFRKEVEPTYDNASRLTEMKVSGQIQMSDIVYNPLSQVTELKTGAFTNNADVEQYSYDTQTGLLTNQQVIKQNTSQPLLNLSYNYNRLGSKGSLNGKTGQLTNIVNNLDSNKNRVYEFDTLGRLTTAKGGVAAGGSGVANWTQNYSYDRYGNRLSVGINSGSVTANNQAVPLDGLASLSYDNTSNRITNTNYEYDLSGNQTRGQKPDGTFQRFDYDAAGRLVVVRDDAGTPIESYSYGASRQRLKTEAGSLTTYYAWGGSSVLCEYTETTGNGATFAFKKSYIYAGARLLSTQIWNGSSETTEFHHPDRLGTKLVTNNLANTFYEQSTLPFGTSLDAEFIGTPTTNQRFTSYDRSTVASLDYAVNRSYSSGQGRFTSVDPIGFASSNIINPQSLNLFSYVENNPVDFIDPSGLIKLKEKPSQPDWEGFFRFLMDSLEFSRGPWISYHEEGGGGGGGGSAVHEAMHEQQKRCPPNIADLLKKHPDWFPPVVEKVLAQASKNNPNRVDAGRYKEVGGWILMNPNNGGVEAYIKPSEPEPKWEQDLATRKWGWTRGDKGNGVMLDQPGMNAGAAQRLKQGWVVVANFHSHPNKSPSPGDDQKLANDYKIPGIWIYPDGTFEVYGPKRGIMNKGVPKGCPKN